MARPLTPPWQTPLVGAKVAAFFDLDRTVIAKASLAAFSRPFYKEGLLSRRLLARALWGQVLFARFGARQARIERLRLRVQRLTEGWEQERVRSIVASTLAQVVGPITYKEAFELMAEHQYAGRKVYIVSASPAEIVEPLARYLGADGAIATSAAVSAGRYTGQLLRYAFGPEKADAIRETAERDNLDLTESWAYSDSATDLPMLEAVGHPVAVNPDKALRQIARMRNWPILTFSQLAVVTPSGHRPLRAGLAAASAAMALAAVALLLALVVRRRPTAAMTTR
jgi:HAD superfamily hydrolase (TIGR01490 family)